MRQLAFIAGLIVLLSLGNRILAEKPVSTSAKANGASGDENEQAGAERKRRTHFMQSLAGRHTLVTADKRQAPLVLADEPALRYTNPVRNFFSDGAIFLWLDDKRPLAAGAPSIRGEGNVFFEFTSLTGIPLECRREGKLIWMPRTGNLVGQSLSNAEPPGDADRVRLRQMRSMARQFRVVTKSEPDVELRLMSQPVYRYAAEKAGVVDGAVFAFVEATDPDFLLVLEACLDDAAAGVAEWRYTLARLCSRPIEVDFDGRRIWSADGYWRNPRSPNDPYSEMPVGTYPPAG